MMTNISDLDSLQKLQNDVETFIRSLAQPVVVEDEVTLFDLSSARWRLTIEFGKLNFEAWNPARSVVRRVEGLAYRDGQRLSLFVRKPHARETSTIEFAELTMQPGDRNRDANRRQFHSQCLAMLVREFPRWRFEHVSNRSDREHSFSTWYTRGLARQGRTGWAFLALDENEPLAAADAVLAFGLIWLDWLRSHSDRTIVTNLKLFLPMPTIELLGPRMTCLNRQAAQVEVFKWKPGDLAPTPVNMAEIGEPVARLVPRRQGEALPNRHRSMLQELLGESFDRLTIVPDSSGSFLSIRVAGLEVARVEGEMSPRVLFGLEGNVRKLDETSRDAFREFVLAVLARRVAGNPNQADEFYRPQRERWLESLLVQDITKLDAALVPEFVYSQVPAFSSGDRGVIDILGVTKNGQLAVIELKLQEEINLPFQALDYWIRVRSLAEHHRFREFGYFPGAELASRPPRLYLVAPAFRFHSSIDRMLCYLDPSIEIVRVGINEQWREGVRILFRQPRHDRNKA